MTMGASLFGTACAAPRGGKFLTCPLPRHGFHKEKLVATNRRGRVPSSRKTQASCRPAGQVRRHEAATHGRGRIGRDELTRPAGSSCSTRDNGHRSPSSRRSASTFWDGRARTKWSGISRHSPRRRDPPARRKVSQIACALPATLPPSRTRPKEFGLWPRVFNLWNRCRGNGQVENLPPRGTEDTDKLKTCPTGGDVEAVSA